jgi:hypothetical protein
MIYLELLFFVLFISCTVFGYKKNNRDLMLIGAFCSLIAFTVPQAIDRFNESTPSESTL